MAQASIGTMGWFARASMIFCVVFGGGYLAWLIWAEGWILAGLIGLLTLVAVIGLAVHTVLSERKD